MWQRLLRGTLSDSADRGLGSCTKPSVGSGLRRTACPAWVRRCRDRNCDRLASQSGHGTVHALDALEPHRCAGCPAAWTQAVQSWLVANPPEIGINWASSLEPAHRLISWCWSASGETVTVDTHALQGRPCWLTLQRTQERWVVLPGS